jgi:hypothetical protein
MTQPSYASLVANLRRADVPIREIGSRAKVAVTKAAGRIIAAAFTESGENLFWSNPLLMDESFTVQRWTELIAGPGGERLWFSPETDYNWDGAPNWQTLENYRVPAEIDPGTYEFVEEGPEVISMRSCGVAPVHGVDRRVGFEVLRRIHLAPSPIEHEELEALRVDYLGVETSHRLRMIDDTRSGRLGLWHLLQVPAQSLLVVPIKPVDVPGGALQSYALPGSWEVHRDHMSWRFGGVEKAKIGLAAQVLTGRSAVFRRLQTNTWCMIIRDFPVDPVGTYFDHPHGVPRNDQAFQAWDGLGFGEMEFHSPGLDARRRPEVHKESDRLWAFGGDAKTIISLAMRLLKVDVDYLFRDSSD